MQNLTLSQIQYTQLDAATWCATADVSSALPTAYHPLSPPFTASSSLNTDDSTDNHTQMNHQAEACFADLSWQYVVKRHTSAQKKAQHKRQQQRDGVRLLLQQLLATLDIDDTLDESQFPYQLSEHRYYVCFSHSGGGRHSKVAVAISYRRAVGIDIETHDVEWHVAQRFYHSEELAVLTRLPKTDRPLAAKVLWQVKESFIKVHQYTLAQGLGINYAPIISDLNIASSDATAPLPLFSSKAYQASDYQVVFSAQQQVIIVF